MDVLVFRTDLNRQQLSSLTQAMTLLGGLQRWSVDWEDCDRVLRIESDNLPTQVVIEQLNRAEIQCEELT